MAVIRADKKATIAQLTTCMQGMQKSVSEYTTHWTLKQQKTTPGVTLVSYEQEAEATVHTG